MKITDPNYSLPCIEALTPLGQMENSANKPILVSGVDIKTGARGEYVAKLNGSERMQVISFRSKELIAAFMAMELGLNVVEPAVIKISPKFLEITKGKEYFGTVQKSIGYNVGSKYLGKAMVPVTNPVFNVAQLANAAEIFAFDVLIQNIDRTLESGGKPNLMTDGEKLILLDHELAFSFAELLFNFNKTPWIINEGDLTWIRKHILFKHINHQEVNYQEILNKFHIFDAHFWKQVDVLMPEEWKSDLIEKIKEHVNSIIQKKEIFSNSLNYLK